MFQQFFGISVFASILIVAVVVSIYTVLGGLKAVVVTETFKTIFLFLGACIITAYALLAYKTQVLAGRVSSVLVMLLAIAWSTQGGRYSSIFEAINVIAADLAPPLRRSSCSGSSGGGEPKRQRSLATGFAMGALCFVLDLPVFGTEKLISHGLGISFLLQAWWGFCICSALILGVSLLTPPPAPEQVDGLTWGIRFR